MGYPDGFPPANMGPGDCAFFVNADTGNTVVAHGRNNGQPPVITVGKGAPQSGCQDFGTYDPTP
jgi:hypothetical protein